MKVKTGINVQEALTKDNYLSHQKKQGCRQLPQKLMCGTSSLNKSFHTFLFKGKLRFF